MVLPVPRYSPTICPFCALFAVKLCAPPSDNPFGPVAVATLMISERRSGRIASQIRIVLMGTDTSGRVFSEETRTVVLSRHGAGVLSKFRVALDEILTMRFLGGSTEVAVRLVGELGHDSRGYTLSLIHI